MPPKDIYLFIEKNKTTALWPAGPGRPECMNLFPTGLSFYHKVLLKQPDFVVFSTYLTTGVGR